MQSGLRLFIVAVLMGTPLMAGAEGTSGSKPMTDYERIQIQLEYHQRLVKLTENYLRDRAKIPAGYQDVSDKEFLRKSNAERPVKSLADLKSPHAEMAAEPASKSASKPAPKPEKSPAKPKTN